MVEWAETRACFAGARSDPTVNVKKRNVLILYHYSGIIRMFTTVRNNMSGATSAQRSECGNLKAPVNNKKGQNKSTRLPHHFEVCQRIQKCVHAKSNVVLNTIITIKNDQTPNSERAREPNNNVWNVTKYFVIAKSTPPPPPNYPHSVCRTHEWIAYNVGCCHSPNPEIIVMLLLAEQLHSIRGADAG